MIKDTMDDHYPNFGWWYTYPCEKYEFVSWDDENSQLNGKKVHVPNHQFVPVCCARHVERT